MLRSDTVLPRIPSIMRASPLLVIPPINTSEYNCAFTFELQSFLESELEKIDPNNTDQRYTCFKRAFNKVIDHADVYKPLLTEIKAEYEDFVDKIKMGRHEATYLKGKIKSIVSEPSTIRNYRMRGDELEEKLVIVDDDNERLAKELAELKAARIEKIQKRELLREADKAPPPRKQDPRPIPGLALKHATNIKVLNHLVKKLDRQLQELNIAHRTRYAPKQDMDKLKTQLEHKVELRDDLSNALDLMHAKRFKLKVAVKAAQEYLDMQQPHQTIGDAIISTIIKANKQVSEKGGEGIGQSSGTFVDDDPTREKEAEMMVEYIEKFNELLEDGMVEDAAVHAANSPKGILRTLETLNRFKALTSRTNEGHNPVLIFAEALLSTASAFDVKVSDIISQECVKSCLDENRLDLLKHWLSQKSLTVTLQIGNMIRRWCEKHPSASRRYLSLAQTVYKNVHAHIPAVICMVQQGRLFQVKEYTRKWARFKIDDYVEVLKKCPTTSYVGIIYPSLDGAVVPLGVIVTTLFKTDGYQVGLDLILRIHEEDNKTSLNDVIYDDNRTTKDEWQEISLRLEEQGFHSAALHLLSSVIIAFAIKGAYKVLKEFPIQPKGKNLGMPGPQGLLTSGNKSSAFTTRERQRPPVVPPVAPPVLCKPDMKPEFKRPQTIPDPPGHVPESSVKASMKPHTGDLRAPRIRTESSDNRSITQSSESHPPSLTAKEKKNLGVPKWC